MFYYRLTVRSKGRSNSRTSTNHYREYLRLGDLGADVGTYAFRPSTTSVTVTKISQKAYVNATRPGE